MQIITKPTNKLGKVTWLLNIAKELNISNDKMFDDLMDKYESNYHVFDFMYETINSMIIDLAPIEETKIAFITCLRCDNFKQIGSFLEKVNKKFINDNQRLHF